MRNEISCTSSIISIIVDSSLLNSSGGDWSALYEFSKNQCVEAIVWENISHLVKIKDSPKQSAPLVLKLKWALAAEQIETRYAHQKAVISKLAKFFSEHGIKMLILKGYGLSLNYPTPNHRPCGDVDIWLFEEQVDADGSVQRVVAQQRADKLLQEHFGVEVDNDKHHHTVFYIDGVMVENHYDFLNIHSHRSNKIIEYRLLELVQQPLEAVDVDGATVYFPSADFHALFLLRHSASHFAAERITLRHLLDWRYFVERYSRDMDWTGLQEFARKMNMHRFLNAMNAICIDYLGLPSECVPAFDRDAALEQRVWNEILHPEFSEEMPKGVGYLKSWRFMFRRWWANRWKHRIVYREGLLSTFWIQLWSHLLKPKSLKL